MDRIPDLNLQRYVPHIKQQMLKELLTNKTYGKQEWLQLARLLDIHTSQAQAFVRLLLISPGMQVETEELFAIANIAEELFRVEGLFSISTTIGQNLVILVEAGSMECMQRSVQWLRYYYKRFDKLNFRAVITDEDDINHVRGLYKDALRQLGNKPGGSRPLAEQPAVYRTDPQARGYPAASTEQYGKSLTPELVVRMIAYVEDHLSDPSLTLSKLSKEVFYMNGDYLGKLFRQHTGVRFSHYVTSMRIQKAAQYIARDHRMKILDIAAKVGYSHNVQYFSQVFKKMSGCSPSEYRNRLQQQA